MKDPLLKRQLERFKKNKRAHWSFWIISVCFLLSLFAEVWCSEKPLLLHFDGKWFFPLFKHYPAETFEPSITETLNYRDFARSETFRKKGSFILFPPIPYSPHESMDNLSSPPPTSPTRHNWLGTDDRGRDLLTRIVYGFRNSMLFAMASWILISVVAFLIGASQGYIGGRTDFYGQRVVEIWHSLPVLYVIIFLLSIFSANLLLLTLVWVAFSWVALSSYIRAEVLKVRKMDFVNAALALGASHTRILLRHVFPNILNPILTYSPFLISASIGSLAALDYLGLGLPPPTASWGELLRQSKENLQSWWLVVYPFLALFFTLLLLNFVGEGVRSALDTREALI